MKKTVKERSDKIEWLNLKAQFSARPYKSKTTGRKCYDPDGINISRATWALDALRRFQQVTGSDDCDAISDLLCDLRHLCDRDPSFGTWADALHKATCRGSHYDAETSKEG
jgi:hypothetical protein